MMDAGNYYVVETMFPFGAPFIDRELGLLKKGDLTRMISFNMEMVSSLPLSHNGMSWTTREQASLWSEI